MLPCEYNHDLAVFLIYLGSILGVVFAAIGFVLYPKRNVQLIYYLSLSLFGIFLLDFSLLHVGSQDIYPQISTETFSIRTIHKSSVNFFAATSLVTCAYVLAEKKSLLHWFILIVLGYFFFLGAAPT